MNSGRGLRKLPLTAATGAGHVKEDLASRDLTPWADKVRAMESLAG